MSVHRVELSALQWRKSSYSNQEGGNCIEVSDDLLATVSWRKSSYSNPDGGACIEVSDDLAALVPVRDSKAPAGPALVFGAPVWASFVGAVKSGTLSGR
ncbi:DUF397 domain-containing protein [Streptomyces benahoarensis]|uniref:DUF397 domain-containing protein n=1 Tax=Streptomyces benahoarensis TaxID=2595054 RepID=A0A553ZMV8_9ACTN|nr:DUF397 domain-containing protein [Streptomyces benahoarensis]TSB31414.1 DUF397 domain-containing protein [Streptomyces benahoarensis]TSB42770.1 DUF397 domain-containing protein [Streptomyces benahoarensis]